MARYSDTYEYFWAASALTWEKQATRVRVRGGQAYRIGHPSERARTESHVDGGIQGVLAPDPVNVATQIGR